MQSLGLREEEELEKEIETYCKIARANGSILSVEQLSQIIRLDADRPEIEETLMAYPLLRSNLLLTSGYVIRRPQNIETAEIEATIREEQENRRRAVSNLRTARTFARLLSDRATLVAVGGTNSYLSARAKDDIDLFCIARRDTMWVLMLESLVKARLFGITRRGTPQLCLSFMMDEGWVESEFARPRDAIFARDLLTSKVVRGRDVYTESLRRAGWIDKLFPRLYRMRLDPVGRSEGRGRRPASQSRSGAGVRAALRRVVNSYLYATLGSYILLKAWLLNRRYAKEGQVKHMFTTDLGADHCMYESNRYRSIRRMYNALRAN